MSSKGEGKYNVALTREELPGFFRDLAMSLENGTEFGGDGAGVDFTDFRKFKVSVKKKEEGYWIKLKVKPAGPEDEDVDEEEVDDPGNIAGGGKIKYKHLKKRMKKTWEAIKDSAADDALPPEDAAREFLHDSALMVKFTKKDKGPEYYREYMEAVEAFREAFEERNMTEIRRTVESLHGIKKACHAEYKDD